jgi:NADH-quinone oxidoreductase subunit M
MAALFTTLFIPIVSSLIILLINKNNAKLIKGIALGFSLAAFVSSLILLSQFNSADGTFQFYFESVWIPQFDSGLRIGIDGMSMLLVLLTTFITPIALLSSFGAIGKREKEYYFMLMLLEFAMIGVFVSLDLFLFYIFWEIILIPMYFIIGIWGGKERIYAAVKFFIFTVVGSLFMLAAIVWLGYYVGTNIIHNTSGFTTNFVAIRSALESFPIPMKIQSWLFLAFALSFCIKVPLFPLHTWLPDAHTEAPTPGSVILAGVLLKMGTYGLVRFNLDLFPEASIEFAPVIAVLAVIGIIYGALVSLVQQDVKKLVAYSSVSHLGFVVLGIFSMTVEGIQGGIIQMVNHGLSTGMLFLCVGILYERRHTRLIADYGGIARIMPRFSAFFAIAMLASVGLPGLNGFVGEYLTLFGAFSSPIYDSIWYTVFATTGVIFAAAYLLWMFQRVMFGVVTHAENRNLPDLHKREWLELVPIVLLIVWIGFYPKTFLNISEQSTKVLINKIYDAKNKIGIYQSMR